jgi:hypothetical protein
MLLSLLYRSENMQKMKYAHIGVIVVSVALCAYFLLMLVPDATSLAHAQNKLHDLKGNLVSLNEDARKAREAETRTPAIDGGLDAFVSQVAGWAKARGVSIASVSPDGTPLIVDAVSGGKPIGRWTANSVAVVGHGQFEQVMDLLNQFLITRMPVQLRSCTVQASEGGASGDVSFQFVFAVYEESKSN